MAAHNTPRGIEKTNLFKLGELLGEICRNFLLMTATPHNGKESEFRLFMSLIDKDRFYNAHRRLNQKINIDDTMRRLLKEDLKKFDGSPLFPERRAYTANYSLTDMESDLYKKVTYYVCEEMNRANLIGGQRKGSIGFALTQLQRRLASSPNAIYKSLQRRGNKLQDRLQLIENNNLNIQDLAKIDIPDKFLSELDDCNITEYENYTDTLTELATAANTIPELKAEIIKLKELEHT